MTFKYRHLLALLLAAPLVFAKPHDDPATPPPAVQTDEAQTAEAPDAAAQEPANRFAQDIMLQALGLIGVTYRWGGNSPETGLDCSGFIKYVFQQSLNIALPHNAFAISRLGEDVDKDALKPGDLVFFNTLGRRFSHVGIYLGDDRFIHSPSKGSKVQIVRLSDAYWAKRYNGARRVTHESVAERSPILNSLMAEARESVGKKGKKKGRAAAAKKSGGKKAAAKKAPAKKKRR